MKRIKKFSKTALISILFADWEGVNPDEGGKLSVYHIQNLTKGLANYLQFSTSGKIEFDRV